MFTPPFGHAAMSASEFASRASAAMAPARRLPARAQATQRSQQPAASDTRSAIAGRLGLAQNASESQILASLDAAVSRRDADRSEDALYAAAWGPDAPAAPTASRPAPAPAVRTVSDRTLAALAGWDDPIDDGEDRFPGREV